MSNIPDFDLRDFTPFLLNMAAEKASLDFQTHYKQRYGMLRTEWRVVFHLGQFGPLYAKEICDRARIHKTKVSRAVSALEQKRYLTRETAKTDRRHEKLALTRSGSMVYRDLSQAARAFDDRLMAGFSQKDRDVLRRCLTRIAGM